MKILQIGKFYPIRGGVEKVMLDLTEGLTARGIHCDMLCACIEPPKSRVIPVGPLSRIICVPALKKVAATMIAPQMVTYLRRHCSEYDLIHIHHPDPMAALALRLSGYKGPVVVHWHSDILKQKVIKRFFLPLQNWLLRRACLIVGTTPVYVKESPDLNRYQNKITYLPIGVEPISAPKHPSAPKAEHLIFALGRFVGYKGYEYMIRAAALLPDNYHLVIGGQGPLKSEMEALAARLGAKVTFLGWVPDEERAQWFEACDLFVLSSVTKTEAFAIVQIEAMSCGKPVVATKIPGSGVSWVNENGVSGLNVPIRDPEALAEAIRTIADNPERYAQFSCAAQDRFQRLFTREKMIDGALELYEKAIKEWTR